MRRLKPGQNGPWVKLKERLKLIRPPVLLSDHLDVAGSLLPGDPRVRPQDWAALHAGSVGVLALSCLGRHEPGLRWALGVGLEWRPGVDADRSNGLLLVPGWPVPWGGGFNARLTGDAPQGAKGTPSSWWLRGLDGERLQVASVRRAWLASTAPQA